MSFGTVTNSLNDAASGVAVLLSKKHFINADIKAAITPNKPYAVGDVGAYE